MLPSLLNNRGLRGRWKRAGLVAGVVRLAARCVEQTLKRVGGLVLVFLDKLGSRTTKGELSLALNGSSKDQYVHRYSFAYEPFLRGCSGRELSIAWGLLLGCRRSRREIGMDRLFLVIRTLDCA